VSERKSTTRSLWEKKGLRFIPFCALLPFLLTPSQRSKEKGKRKKGSCAFFPTEIHGIRKEKESFSSLSMEARSLSVRSTEEVNLKKKRRERMGRDRYRLRLRLKTKINNYICLYV